MAIGKLDATTLIAALADLKLAPRQAGELIHFGNRESYNTRTGQMQLSTSRSVSEIKQAYSREVVKSQARRFGWNVRQTGANKFQIVKR